MTCKKPRVWWKVLPGLGETSNLPCQLPGVWGSKNVAEKWLWWEVFCMDPYLRIFRITQVLLFWSFSRNLFLRAVRIILWNPSCWCFGRSKVSLRRLKFSKPHKCNPAWQSPLMRGQVIFWNVQLLLNQDNTKWKAPETKLLNMSVCCVYSTRQWIYESKNRCIALAHKVHLKQHNLLSELWLTTICSPILARL